MTIAASRIKGFTEDFNVSVSDLSNQVDAEILNVKNAVSENITQPLEGLLEAGKSELSEIGSAIADNSAVRGIKSAYGSIIDLSKVTASQLDKMVVDMLPINSAGTAAEFLKLAEKCRNKPAQFAGLGKPYEAKMSCNGGASRSTSSNSCDTAQFGNMLNSLTGGDYLSTYEDLNKALKRIVGLSSFGYDMDMCGVFGALAKGANASVFSRAAAAVAVTLAGKAKVTSQMDVAKSLTGTTTVVSKEIPNISKISTSNYATPSNLKATQVAASTEGYVTALTVLEGTTDAKTEVAVSTIQPNAALVKDLNIFAVSENTITKTSLGKASTSSASLLSVAALAKANAAKLSSSVRV